MRTARLLVPAALAAVLLGCSDDGATATTTSAAPRTTAEQSTSTTEGSGPPLVHVLLVDTDVEGYPVVLGGDERFFDLAEGLCDDAVGIPAPVESEQRTFLVSDRTLFPLVESSAQRLPAAAPVVDAVVADAESCSDDTVDLTVERLPGPGDEAARLEMRGVGDRSRQQVTIWLARAGEVVLTVVRVDDGTGPPVDGPALLETMVRRAEG